MKRASESKGTPERVGERVTESACLVAACTPLLALSPTRLCLDERVSRLSDSPDLHARRCSCNAAERRVWGGGTERRADDLTLSARSNRRDVSRGCECRDNTRQEGRRRDASGGGEGKSEAEPRGGQTEQRATEPFKKIILDAVFKRVFQMNQPIVQETKQLCQLYHSRSTLTLK